jgi:hypothetical protein
MVTFHPAYILRQTGGEIEAVKRMVWADLKAIRTKLDEFPIPDVTLSPSGVTLSPSGVTLSLSKGDDEEALQSGLFE